jgi:hypothetical protein
VQNATDDEFDKMMDDSWNSLSPSQRARMEKMGDSMTSTMGNKHGVKRG